MHPMVTTAAGMAAKAMAARRNWRNLWWGREAIVRFRMKKQFWVFFCKLYILSGISKKCRQIREDIGLVNLTY